MNIGRRVSTSDFIGDETEEEDYMMIVDLVVAGLQLEIL